MSRAHGLRFEDTRFWVIHRSREYGPFDYEWSKDFCGIELTYRGSKFGEYCSVDEIYADLKPFALPMRVVEVTSIVSGCILFGVLNGLSDAEKRALVGRRLREFGHEQFAAVDGEAV